MLRIARPAHLFVCAGLDLRLVPERLSSRQDQRGDTSSRIMAALASNVLLATKHILSGRTSFTPHQKTYLFVFEAPTQDDGIATPMFFFTFDTTAMIQGPIIQGETETYKGVRHAE